MAGGANQGDESSTRRAGGRTEGSPDHDEVVRRSPRRSRGTHRGDAAPPCAGLNVNFEMYCGFAINTTLTALVFGER